MLYHQKNKLRLSGPPSLASTSTWSPFLILFQPLESTQALLNPNGCFYLSLSRLYQCSILSFYFSVSFSFRVLQFFSIFILHGGYSMGSYHFYAFDAVHSNLGQWPCPVTFLHPIQANLQLSLKVCITVSKHPTFLRTCFVGQLLLSNYTRHCIIFCNPWEHLHFLVRKSTFNRLNQDKIMSFTLFGYS